MEIRKPARESHQYTQRINANAKEVFPLLCPVRESEWIPGWDPRLVLTESGFAEQGAAFVTEVDGREATWVITQHDPEAGFVAMVEIVPRLVVIELSIQVNGVGESEAECVISYTYTALSPDGEVFVRERTPEWYLGFMGEWEGLLNSHFDLDPSASHQTEVLK